MTDVLRSVVSRNAKIMPADLFEDDLLFDFLISKFRSLVLFVLNSCSIRAQFVLLDFSKIVDFVKFVRVFKLN